MEQAASTIDTRLFLPALARASVILPHDVEEIQNYIFSRMLSRPCDLLSLSRISTPVKGAIPFRGPCKKKRFEGRSLSNFYFIKLCLLPRGRRDAILKRGVFSISARCRAGWILTVGKIDGRLVEESREVVQLSIRAAGRNNGNRGINNSCLTVCFNPGFRKGESPVRPDFAGGFYGGAHTVRSKLASPDAKRQNHDPPPAISRGCHRMRVYCFAQPHSRLFTHKFTTRA